MIQTTTTQLELNLWSDLKAATLAPETADLQKLFQDLSRVVAEVQKDQRLQVAGEAIAQIVEVYVRRANLILDSLEVRDTSVGPILSEDFLSDMMRQSMTIDLSDLMENLFPKQPDSKPMHTTSQTLAAPVDKQAALVMAHQESFDAYEMMQELAGEESVSQWTSALDLWMQQHSGFLSVSLIELQQELGMPMVEVWLGLLLGGQYQMQQLGEFYEPSGIFVLKQDAVECA